MTLLLALMLAGAETTTAALLQTGTFHGDEVSAKDGSSWMALVRSIGGYTWRSVRVSVKTVHDPISGMMDGKTVSVPGISPMFLLANRAPWMSRPPRQVFYAGPGQTIDEPIQLGERGRLSLHVRKLVFEDRGIAQAIYDWPMPPADEHRELLWAGDLDGDGRTDLLINVSASKRTGNGLVGLASELIQRGC